VIAEALDTEKARKTRERATRNWGKLLEPRVGICLHYDESASDRGAVEWLLFDRQCKVSYNDLVLDNGDVIEICPPDRRAWHAGICRPSDPRLPYRDANSALYGIAVAAKHSERATPKQLAAVVARCVAIFQAHRWPVAETWRIVGHRAEAWPRGRKDDPDGKLGVVVDVNAVRAAVSDALRAR
jgi:N-acetyl-anhydromuramyl-L-alanine amidase AmpD